MPNFKFFKLAPVLFVLAFVLFSHNVSLAQERTRETLTRIEIKDVKIEKSDTEIKISGALFNPSSNIVAPEITHLLILKTIDPLINPKDEREMLPSLIVSAEEGKDYFSLKPNERKVFSYILPFSPYIPQANYSLYLGFIRSNGQAEASYNETVKNLGSSQKDGFLAFDQESCFLLNKEGKKFGNNDGPTFLPGESPETRCLVKNIGDKEIEVSPKILWKEVYVYGKPLDGTMAAETLDQKIFFKPGETKLVSLAMPKAEKPQVYQSLVSLEDKDGESRSFNMFFRWTIAGESARIKKVAQISPLKDSYAKGEKIDLSVDYFGSADLFWTGTGQNVSNLNNLTIKAVIKDGNGNICGEKEEVLANVADAEEKNKVIEVVLDKKCKNMSYNVSLSSSQKSLAEESGELPKVVKEQTIANYLYFGALALIVLLAFIFFRKRKIVPIHLLFMLFAGAAMFFGAVSTTSAAVTTITYPANGGLTSTYQWWGDWNGTTVDLKSSPGGGTNKLSVFYAKVDFSDYFNGLGSLGEVYTDFFANDSACSNSGMKVSIMMSIEAINNDGSFFQQDIYFAKKGSPKWSLEKRFDYNQTSPAPDWKEFEIQPSELRNLYNSDLTLKSNPKLIIHFRQAGYHTSTGQYTQGYFTNKNTTLRSIDNALSKSDVIKIEIPLKLPDPSVSLTVAPDTSSTFASATTVTPPSDNVKVKLDTTDMTNCLFANFPSYNSPSGTAFDGLTFNIPLSGGTESETKTVSRVWSPSASTAVQNNKLTMTCYRDLGSAIGGVGSYSANADVVVNPPNYWLIMSESPFGTGSGTVKVDLFRPTTFAADYSGDKGGANIGSKIMAAAGAVKNIFNRAEAFSRDFSKHLAVSASITYSSSVFPLPLPVPAGTDVTLTATADPGSAFQGWNITTPVPCSGGPTSNPCAFTMPAQNQFVGFEFVSSTKSSSSSSSSSGGGGGGSSSSGGGGGAISGACGTAVNTGWATAPTTNLCSAGSPSSVSGGAGSSWTWTCNGSGGGSDASCSASYDPGTVNLTVIQTGTGSGSVSLMHMGSLDGNNNGFDTNVPGSSPWGLAKDWIFQITATPSSGSSLGSVSGGGCGNSPCTITMDGDKVVTVTFNSDTGCCGGGGAVTAYISARKNPVSDGGATDIDWGSTNATSCAQSDGGNDSVGWGNAADTISGSYYATGFSTSEGPRTYTIDCTNGSQTASASVVVGVGGVAGNSSVDIWADESSIKNKGTTTIRWSSVNSVWNCMLYSDIDSLAGYLNGPYGNVPPWSSVFGAGYYKTGAPDRNIITGQKTGALTSDTTYKIRCTGIGFVAVTDSTTVTVAPPVSDFTFTNTTGDMTATIVEGLSANSSSATLVFGGSAIGNVTLSASIPSILSGAKAQFSSDNGVTWNDTLSVDINVISQVKIKVINIPGTALLGTYNVAITGKDNQRTAPRVNINLQVKKVSSEWQEF